MKENTLDYINRQFDDYQLTLNRPKNLISRTIRVDQTELDELIDLLDLTDTGKRFL